MLLIVLLCEEYCRFFKNTFSFLASSSSFRSLRFFFLKVVFFLCTRIFCAFFAVFLQPVPDSVLGNVVLLRHTLYRPSIFRVHPHYPFPEFLIVTCRCFSLLHLLYHFWGFCYRLIIARHILIAYRIIPMRVGTSDSRRTAISVAQDHPHACGDKTNL